jgi:hypothetical protein
MMENNQGGTMDELEAVKEVEHELASLEDFFGDKERGVITLKAPVLRAILAMATRPHD